ncbi:Anthranilate phosphoribosyltransferase [Buchnera aphidicola (Thelaxes suberi)]|uniref:anthranilate phosphoribosyltransferase n=1 Tax=Buchnera aphidicola TaxID=9 RepID=UPI003463B3EA
MKDIFKKMYSYKELSEQETYNLFNHIIFKKKNNIELTASLIAMKMRGERYNEILGITRLFLEKSRLFPSPKYKFADIVGTGGDNYNDINISTISSFVASSLGLKIAKHCNVSITSKSGSSNILKKFNINLNISPKISRFFLDKFNICFLFAPFYHQGFRQAHPIRKFLNTRTIFNILGPLTNPAKPPFTLIGVYHKKWINVIIRILKELKYQRAIVLCSNNTDEVTLFTKTYIAELKNKKINSYVLEPQHFGLNTFNFNNINEGGKPKKNHEIITKLLQGQGSEFHEQTIAANVALVLKIFGHENLKENAQNALKIIRSGIVYKKIIKIAQLGKA